MCSLAPVSNAERFRRSGVGAAVNMCRLVLVLTLICIQVQVSSEAPPKLTACRIYYKSKTVSEDITLSSAEGACGETISFPIPTGETINVTDTRNCDNFYKCQGVTCQQCPCPDGETFNPITLQCDASNSLCACPTPQTTSNNLKSEITAGETTAKPTATSKEVSTKETTTLVKESQTQQSNKDDAKDGDKKDGEISTEVIIIAAIVSATVIIIVIIVMAVFLWQKGRSSHNKPRSKMPSMGNDGYAPSMAPSERHVYAEIDEQMIAGNKHWNHGGSIRAPPLPSHQPPSSIASSPCPHHCRSDSGLGSTDTSFNSNYPKKSYHPQHMNHPHSVRYVKERHMLSGTPPAQSPAGADEVYHNTEDSVSSESQYSASSHQTSLDSHDVDMNTPLHHPSIHNYMSRQVYI